MNRYGQVHICSDNDKNDTTVTDPSAVAEVVNGKTYQKFTVKEAGFCKPMTYIGGK